MIPLNYEQAKEFLAKNNIKNCEIKQVAGDCSFRSYYRILSDKTPYILMFAPPSHEEIEPFQKIDEFLITNGFSAPKIFAADKEEGFLLLEDFGDDTYGRVLAKDNSGELDLYVRAVDVLLKLHKIKAPQDLKIYNHALLFREIMVGIEWYFIKLKGRKISSKEMANLKFLFFELFDLISKENQSLVLLDYHADNLMILKNKKDVESVGLLDFQDARIGSKAYDLVSLLEDARRDVDEDNRQKLFQYYLDNSQTDKNAFKQDYEILSLQRNIKILGIFARMSIRNGKDSYLKMIPRVVGFIEKRLNSDSKIFSEIKILLKNIL